MEEKGKGAKSSKKIEKEFESLSLMSFFLCAFTGYFSPTDGEREKTSWSTSSLSLLILNLNRVETLKLFLVKPVSLPTPLLLVPLRRKLSIFFEPLRGPLFQGIMKGQFLLPRAYFRPFLLTPKLFLLFFPFCLLIIVVFPHPLSLILCPVYIFGKKE